MEHSVLNRISSSNPSPQSSGRYAEDKEEKLKEPGGIGDRKETMTHTHTHTNSETGVVCTGPAQVQATWVPTLKVGNGHHR